MTELPYEPPSSQPYSTPSPGSVNLESGDPSHYLNRELSWLEFNARVLAEAETPEVPLFERLKFLGIFSSNLDEFFMVRVAGLKAQQGGKFGDLPPDGMTPDEQLAKISERAHALVERAYKLWNTDVYPALERAGIAIVHPDQLEAGELAALDERFRGEIFPVLTPLAIDPGHPFPHLRNKNINLGIMLTRDQTHAGFGVIQVPAMMNRLIPVKMPNTERAFVLLEDLVARHVHQFFQATRIRGTYPFRVTRNFDLEIDEEEGEDLLQTIQAELRRRDRGNAVRVEIGIGDGVDASVARLCRALHLDPRQDVYRVPGPLNFADLLSIIDGDVRREYKDERFSPQIPGPLRDNDNLFQVIRERDVLLHHPFDSFDPVVEFINHAADDPDVLAIKQTLYRAGGDSPIVKALARAAENGKQVTAIVELKARFDEASNIRWAHTLEQSGAQVIYGLLGLKTHAKALLVVRREQMGLKRYVHLSTGNYNQGTARHYTDVGLLTSNDEIGADVTSLFNLLTGYSAPPRWHRLVVAPLGLHEAVLGLIARETAHARAGRKASIHAQMNALVDVDVIDALYSASEAGVDIHLRVRGICCLRPGIAGLSSRIRVHAIIDRFLEHTRLFRFENGGTPELYISSADWMPRNFHRRVEVLTPILDEHMKQRLEEIREILFSDVAKTWQLNAEGLYERMPAAAGAIRSQQRFMELARERAKQSDPLVRPNSVSVLGAQVPTEEERKARRAKERQKKKQSRFA
ncbi:MAG: polyphosphate kinase 1 [Polyangiaceae bacterium]|nr:polyphosphate kinase 1 [Polyangiaceae bacterium]